MLFRTNMTVLVCPENGFLCIDLLFTCFITWLLSSMLIEISLTFFDIIALSCMNYWTVLTKNRKKKINHEKNFFASHRSIDFLWKHFAPESLPERRNLHWKEKDLVRSKFIADVQVTVTNIMEQIPFKDHHPMLHSGQQLNKDMRCC